MLCKGFVIRSIDGHFIGLHGKALKKVNVDNAYIFTNFSNAEKALEHLNTFEYSIYEAALIVKDKDVK